MSIYEALMLLAASAVFALALASMNWRGALWIAAIVVDLYASTLWWTNDLPFGDVATAACDFTLCVLIYFLARYIWELWLFLLFQLSVLVSIVDLASGIAAPGWLGHDTYSTALELINYLAFIVVGSVSGFAIANRFNALAFRPWRRVLPFSGALRRTGKAD